MNWQPGQWVECPQTQEKGMIEPYEGEAVVINLGKGVKIYASYQVLEQLGWRLMFPVGSDSAKP
ncbi:MAG: hypothetical protein F6K19_18090 [Cyanothece sp. SIO1E1]|nr:hypothetical protein [Cyanothece sp. SIO1E1]